jgi:hypothetical protein
MTHIFIMHENGDAGAHRQIFMDGRKHPAPDDLGPDMVRPLDGRWDGDTLSSTPSATTARTGTTRRACHTRNSCTRSKRYSRPNYGTLVDNITIEDPGTFTQPINLKLTATHVRPGHELIGVDLH